jgi:uncharacterized protein (TIGR02996 family)
MTHEDAFLQTIAENPEDGPRLVYADWLDEHGRAERAEFIRLQCELAGMAVFNAHRRRLQVRQQQMLDAHGAAWLKEEWPQVGEPVITPRTFVRGFVAELSLQGRGLHNRDVVALAGCPRLALVASLDLRGNRVRASGLRALGGSPYVAGLTFLDLRQNRLPHLLRDSLRPLAASPYLAQLRELVLDAADARLVEVRTLFLLHNRDIAVHA